MARILAFGASIVKGHNDREYGGWTNRLDLYLRNKGTDAPVYNLGVSGDTTSDLMERMEQEIRARTKEGEDLIILVSAGMKDSIVMTRTRKDRVSVKQFSENLRVIWLIAKRYAKKVIFVGFNPVDKRVDPVPWKDNYTYTNERVQEFNSVVRMFCEENKLGFVEVYEDWIREDYSRLLDDGLHPNSDGHQRIFESVRDVLERKNLV